MLDFELTKEKVKKKNLMNFTRQLAVFVKAGIPITDALTTIADETVDVALRRALTEMTEDLRNGGLFSASAAQHPQVFPKYYVGSSVPRFAVGRRSLDSRANILTRDETVRRYLPLLPAGSLGGGAFFPSGRRLRLHSSNRFLGTHPTSLRRGCCHFSLFFTDLW